MKNTLKNILKTTAAIACLAASTGYASLITWDDGAADDNWSSGANWTGTPDNTSPVNGDSVALIATTQSFLDYSWTIESGQSLTSSTTAFGDDLGIGRTNTTVGSLRLASGGSMDIGFLRPRSTAGAGNGNEFIIEANASLDTDVYGLGSRNLDITYIADAAGVTTWNNSGTSAGQFSIALDTLTVDLSAFSTTPTDLVLVNYGAGSLSGAFSSVTLINGAGTVDYTTGDQIRLLGAQAIPEPSSLALLAAGFGLVMVVRRRMARV